LRDTQIPQQHARIISFGGIAILAAWLILSIVNVRMIIPLWSTEINLWEWAQTTAPGFIDVESRLISVYVSQGYDAKAWAVIDTVLAKNTPCASCMLNAANLAIREHKVGRAAFFLEKANADAQLHADPGLYRSYLTIQSKALLLQGNAPAAEQAARKAIAVDSLNPFLQIALANALRSEGKVREAQQVEESAIALMTPDMRARYSRKIENAQNSSPNTIHASR